MLKKILFSLLLLATGIWLVIDDLFSPLSVSREAVEIPMLCGRELVGLTESEDLDYEIEYRYDAGTDAGIVISQDPIGGSRRKKTDGEPIRVRLVVSLGTERITLPHLVGSDRREAEARLRELGCTVETLYRSGAYPAGEVLAMEPRGGTEVPKGSHVQLTVSAGIPEESVTVPDFCGLPRADALVGLWLSRLSLAEVVEIESDQPEGLVVRQSHPSGTLVPAGTRITLYVSRFPSE